MVLGESGDPKFEELKKKYSLTSKELVGQIETVETTQEGKPLQVFPNPRPIQLEYFIRHKFKEFTSLCPKTGQPDFATVIVEYTPRNWCVEMKALKLYYGSYRAEGHFIEELTNLIFEDLQKVLEPIWLRVIVRFNTRGGMDAECSREAPTFSLPIQGEDT